MAMTAGSQPPEQNQHERHCHGPQRQEKTRRSNDKTVEETRKERKRREEREREKEKKREKEGKGRRTKKGNERIAAAVSQQVH